MGLVAAQFGQERVDDELSLASFGGELVAEGPADASDAVGGVAGVLQRAVFAFGELPFRGDVVPEPLAAAVFDQSGRHAVGGCVLGHASSVHKVI